MRTSFECENARLLSAMLPAEERPLFDFCSGIDRIGGTTDQRPHPRPAPLVLSADGRPPLEAREPRALDWSGEPARESGALSAATPSTLMAIFVTGSTGLPGQLPAAGLLTSTATAEPLGARQERAEARERHVDFAATAFEFLILEYLNTRPALSRRFDRRIILVSPMTTIMRWWTPRIR